MRKYEIVSSFERLFLNVLSYSILGWEKCDQITLINFQDVHLQVIVRLSAIMQNSSFLTIQQKHELWLQIVYRLIWLGFYNKNNMLLCVFNRCKISENNKWIYIFQPIFLFIFHTPLSNLGNMVDGETWISITITNKVISDSCCLWVLSWGLMSFNSEEFHFEAHSTHYWVKFANWFALKSAITGSQYSPSLIIWTR